MGYSKEIYVGAFLDVKGFPKVSSTFKGCSICGKKDYTHNFCSDCGCKIESLKGPDIETGYTELLYEKGKGEDWKDRLIEVKGQLLIGNNFKFHKLSSILEEKGVLPFLSEDRLSEHCITEFKEEFKDIIEFLKENCESVDLQFGIVSYWS